MIKAWLILSFTATSILAASPTPQFTNTTSAVQGAATTISQQTKSEQAQARANFVKNVFRRAWTAYYDLAFPADELLANSETGGYSRNGWGATAVDALSTAIVMGEKHSVAQMVKHITTIDWSISHNDTVVNVFETTIRYLGGLLSAYDLLSGPHQDLCPDAKECQLILQQAIHLSNNISFAFDPVSGVPHNQIFVTNRTTADSIVPLAAAGTLTLEWSRLADLTGNKAYEKMIKRAMDNLLRRQMPTNEPFPGLLADQVLIKTGRPIGRHGGWDWDSDSYYEYLLKIYVYEPLRFLQYKERWVDAAESTMKHLASRVTFGKNLTFIANFEANTIVTSATHLSCFAGGNFILGGLVLKDKRYLDFGLSLTETCQYLCSRTATGIAPEKFAWNLANGDDQKLSKTEHKFLRRNGFAITDAAYKLRPEVLESLYYAYRATGDKKYQDWSFQLFENIERESRQRAGYSSFTSSVDTKRADDGRPVVEEHQFDDMQESYFLAETLKYAYLIHVEDREYQVNYKGANQWVFSTEGHPMKVVGRWT